MPEVSLAEVSCPSAEVALSVVSKVFVLEELGEVVLVVPSVADVAVLVTVVAVVVLLGLDVMLSSVDAVVD